MPIKAKVSAVFVSLMLLLIAFMTGWIPPDVIKKAGMEQIAKCSVIVLVFSMGHQIIVQPDPYHMGRGQVILRDENGVLCGATEKRTDGQIMSY